MSSMYFDFFLCIQQKKKKTSVVPNGILFNIRHISHVCTTITCMSNYLYFVQAREFDIELFELEKITIFRVYCAGKCNKYMYMYAYRISPTSIH